MLKAKKEEERQKKEARKAEERKKNLEANKHKAFLCADCFKSDVGRCKAH